MPSLSSIDAVQAYQYDMWTPAENGWRDSKPALHINKQGRKKYGLQTLNQDGILADQVVFDFDTAEVTIIRRFKAPIPKKDYLELIKQKNFGKIREHIHGYRLEVNPPQCTPGPILDAIIRIANDHIGQSKLSTQQTLRWGTSSTKSINKAIEAFRELPPADLIMEDEPTAIDPKIKYAPWIRRRDKKYTPLLDEKGNIYAASRRYAFDSHYALSVCKVFKRTLNPQEFEDYVSRQSRTLKEKFVNSSRGLFGSDAFDLRHAVESYKYYPLILLPQDRSTIARHGFDYNRAPNPYVAPQHIADQFPKSYETLQSAFSSTVGMTLPDTGITPTQTSDSMTLSLLMQKIRETRPWYLEHITNG